jgi:phage baseplate assembly protein W
MSYLGMNARTGLRISGIDHLAQSVEKILTTAIGSRHRRRTFGALNADLIDTPSNGAAVLQLYAASATALMAWEPRLRVRSLALSMNADTPGRAVLTINGDTDASSTSAPVSISATIRE